MRRIGTLCAALAALTLANGASAQTAPARPSKLPEIVLTVTEADLATIVTEHGDTIDEMHPYDAPSVRGKTADGLLYTLTGTACDKEKIPNCQGIMMLVRYDADDTVTAETVLAANMHQAALSTWWDKESKTVGVTRYVVLDYGVTRKNVFENLNVLMALTPLAIKYLYGD